MFQKYLDPKNDVAFKRIFGSEKNKEILIHFLNDMITFKKKKPIKDVVFLKPIQEPETAAKKTSIVDILCKDEDGNTYIVEMQVANEKGFIKRAQYYASKAYISQANVGGKFHDLQEIIFLAISNFIMFPNKKAYKSDHVMLDKDTHENDLKDFSFTFVELPKFNKNIDHLANTIEKWVYFFKHATETSDADFQKIIQSDQIIERAYQQLNQLKWTDQELLAYDQAEKYDKAYLASLEYKYDEGKKQGREEGREEGKVEGREEGKKLGIEEGKKQGIEEGKIEGIKLGEKLGKIKMAKILLNQGIHMNTVIVTTGLSEKEILSVLD